MLTILFPFSKTELKITPQSTQLLLRIRAIREKENLFHYVYKIVNSSTVLVVGVSENLLRCECSILMRPYAMSFYLQHNEPVCTVITCAK
jgi:hypothetical protein